MIESRLASGEAVWVGQQTSIIVELKVPGFFSGAPVFDLPELPGLILIPPRDRPLLGSETISGESYTVQRHEVGAFVRRADASVIPPFDVRLGYKVSPLAEEVIRATVATEAVTLNVRVPEGAESLGNLIAARQLSVKDSWSDETNTVRVGDAVIRSLVFEARDLPVIAFPRVLDPVIDGVSFYRHEPELSEKSERGQSSSSRREKLTYVFEREGEFTIPGMSLTWFDLNTEELKTVNLVERMVTVIANPDIAVAAHGETLESASRQTTTPKTVGVIAAALAAIVALVLLSRSAWFGTLIAPFRANHLAPLKPERTASRH